PATPTPHQPPTGGVSAASKPIPALYPGLALTQVEAAQGITPCPAPYRCRACQAPPRPSLIRDPLPLLVSGRRAAASHLKAHHFLQTRLWVSQRSLDEPDFQHRQGKTGGDRQHPFPLQHLAPARPSQQFERLPIVGINRAR